MWRRWWARRAARAGDEAPPGAARAPRTEGLTRSVEDEALLDRIAQGVVRWGMTVPAVFLLESSKPLSFVGSQFLHFISPLAHSLLDARDLDRLAALLERRESVEELIVRIERAETARTTEGQARRAAARERRRRREDG